MPKVSLSLEAAKAKDGDILAKLSRVQHSVQSQKRQTKLSQQRAEWLAQARKLAADARRLEADVQDAAGRLGLPGVATDPGEEPAADCWFQVAGVRQLLVQLQQRDPERLRRAPAQLLSLQDVLASVAAAICSFGGGLEAQAAELEQACDSARCSLRRELSAEGSWPGERQTGESCDLSEEEDALVERIGEGLDAYQSELCALNDRVSQEIRQLELELADLRGKCKDWDEQAHSRFLFIKQQLQTRRDLFMDRLCLEFPHLTREQLLAHEAHCDALKYAAQRQAAAFRQWRRERLSLLRKHEGCLEERQRAEGVEAARQQAVLEQRERQRQLHGRLQAERARASATRAERQRAEEELQRQRRTTEAERESGRQRRAQLLRDLSREHGERRKEQQLRQGEELAEQERRAAAERAGRMERNAEAVRLRRQMAELRQQEAAQQRSLAEQERREREQRLQRALERFQVVAPRDPERLLRLPARSQAEAYSDPLVCVTRGPHAGFDEKRLMSDARYKLSAALQAAGLFSTPAGHEALSRVPAPRPAQPHVVSQVFAGGYPG